MKDQNETYPETSRVIVYGTLKRGGWLHRYLEDCKYIGVRDIVGVEVYCNGHFPYACLAPGAKMFENTRRFIPNPESDKRLIGEVYEVDSETLYMLDCAEGEGRHYFRIEVEIDGVWTFIYIVTREDAVSGHKFVPDGWWTLPEEVTKAEYAWDFDYVEGVLNYYKDKLDEFVMPENREEAHEIIDDLADSFEIWER